MSARSEFRGIVRALRNKVSHDPLGVRASERAMLVGFLDWYRQVIVNKADGLSLEEASRVVTATGMSLLGIIKHLTWVEEGWFRDTFAGEYEGPSVSNEQSFLVEGGDTVVSVVAAYWDECEHSRRIQAGAPSLDKVSTNESRHHGRVTLRWIMVHMIEETARHAGHLDMMREQIDGRTGD
ncbi:MAG: DinB family protein [Acidimicrobiia bacterium]|nr:DinB family protein [Acidimicrobiia bacterium]